MSNYAKLAEVIPRSHYFDDPDQERAGSGLASLPLLHQILGVEELLDWQMSPSEQAVFCLLLSQLRPRVAIEIGTKNGGSLQVLSRFCERVYSLDIDPDVPRRLAGRFANVEYVTGPSDRTLPPLLDRLAREEAELGFVLVDGDHSPEGVRRDIDQLLNYQPKVPFYIIMHDSFNPGCRRGLREANWGANPHVHAVELDLVSGTVNPSPAFRGQLWGGFAMGVLLPEPRTGQFEITGRGELGFQLLTAGNSSGHGRFGTILKRLKKLVGR